MIYLVAHDVDVDEESVALALAHLQVWNRICDTKLHVRILDNPAIARPRARSNAKLLAKIAKTSGGSFKHGPL